MNCAFLLCTCDSYEDTWDPFFKLLTKYWPDIPFNIYINTETKEYTPSFDMPIKPTVCNTADNIPWGMRLIKVLDMIPEDYVFMVLDDFFLKDYVNNKYYFELINLMEKDKNIASIQLKASRLIQEGKKEKEENKDLSLSVVDNSGWKTHFIPTIWRKAILRKWLRKHESIWGFEGYGSQRARIWNYKETVYSVDNPVVFDYLWIEGCSVIVNGKWFDSPLVDDFFALNNIEIDFNQRGRISLEEYKSRNRLYRIRQLTPMQFLKKSINRIKSFF